MIETQRVISKDVHIQIYATGSIDGRLAYAHPATPSMHTVRVEAGPVHACKVLSTCKIPQPFTPEPEVAPLSLAPLL